MMKHTWWGPWAATPAHGAWSPTAANAVRVLAQTKTHDAVVCATLRFSGSGFHSGFRQGKPQKKTTPGGALGPRRRRVDHAVVQPTHDAVVREPVPLLGRLLRQLPLPALREAHPKPSSSVVGCGSILFLCMARFGLASGAALCRPPRPPLGLQRVRSAAPGRCGRAASTFAQLRPAALLASLTASGPRVWPAPGPLSRTELRAAQAASKEQSVLSAVGAAAVAH